MKKLDSQKILDLVSTKDSNYWRKVQEEYSISLFQEAAKGVPAYKDFLKRNKINVGSIKIWQDFLKVPVISKKNYLREYPLKDLCWDGNLSKPLVFTATSGSTGDPFYFVRQNELDWQYSVILENYLNKSNVSKNEPILVIVCFGMGLWIGGLITYKAFEIASNRSNLPISLITPGFNKNEIFNALKNLSPQFKQTIIVGYPPLVKDIVDEAKDYKINLKKLNLRFLFAAEAVTEDFRNYIAKKAGVKNIYDDFMSIYGSADIGAMAYESDISILIRKLSKKNKSLFEDIFSPINKTPTLSQYNPYFTNFESHNGEILITANSAMPLIRYSIGDSGGVFNFSQMESKLEKNNIDLNLEIKNAQIKNYAQLPFVYVYERMDLSTSFYGLLIFPEWIRDSLIKPPLSKYLTGKFTMITKQTKSQDQYLEINLELHKNKTPSEKFKKIVLDRIINSLSSNSSEYREILKDMKENAHPILQFWKSEDPVHFKTGIKQKWVKKEI